MLIQTAHFGTVEIDGDKRFLFRDGLPGLPEETEFVLLQHRQSQPVCWLQSLIHPEIALPVINLFPIYPTYAFDISDADAELLQIEDVQHVIVLNVLVIPPDPAEMTINMAAPIIINMDNHQGRQIFLNDRSYKVRTRVSELLERTEGH